MKYQDIEVGLDFDPEPGLADNGDLETDLQDLLEVVGEAAEADKSCVAIFVDELQYVKEDELGGHDNRVASNIPEASAGDHDRGGSAPGAGSHGQGQILR